MIDKFCYWFFSWWDKQCQAIDELCTFKYPKSEIKHKSKPEEDLTYENEVKALNNLCPTCLKDVGCQCD